MRSGDGLRSCAWTCGALALLAVLAVVAVLAVGGWYLFREPPPGPQERFPTGTEAHFVLLRLRPDDEGMRRLSISAFAQVEERFFVGPSTPSWLRSGRMEGWLEMLPATVEWGAAADHRGVVRVRFEGAHASARALFRVLRWGASATNRVPGAPRATDLPGGVPGVRLPLDQDGELELAFSGNRLLASLEEGRLDELFRAAVAGEDVATVFPGESRPRFPREDGWGWTSAEFQGLPCRVDFSLRLESEDILAFRAGPAEGCSSEWDAVGIRAEVSALIEASGLTPVERPDIARTDAGSWVASGRVAGLHDRVLASIPALLAPQRSYGEAEAVR